MWKEKSLGESPGFWYEDKVDVEAVPEIGTRGGGGGWEQIGKPTGLAVENRVERVKDWWPSGCGLPDRALSCIREVMSWRGGGGAVGLKPWE